MKIMEAEEARTIVKNSKVNNIQKEAEPFFQKTNLRIKVASERGETKTSIIIENPEIRELVIKELIQQNYVLSHKKFDDDTKVDISWPLFK